MDLLTFVLLGVSLASFVAFLVRRKSSRSKRLPPTKPGLPKLVYRNYQTYIDDLALGDIYIFDVFFFRFTRLNSYLAVQEAYVGQADAFTGRDLSAFNREICQDSGIVNIDGPKWQEHRRLMLRSLREFGVGKSLVTDLVQEEVVALNEILSDSAGRPVSTKEVFSAMTNNVIARLIFGQRCGSDDEEFSQFVDHMKEIFTIRAVNAIPFAFPWILKVGFLKRQFVIFDYVKAIFDYVKEKVKRQAEEMKAMDVPPTDISEATNICEVLLIEQAAQEKANPGRHTFTDTQIAATMSDLFFAGTDTTSTTLQWAVLLLALHPETQERLQREIFEQIGRQRLPTMADRQVLPFGCAVIDEVLRYSSLLPVNVFHRATRDVEVLGYFIPANEIIQCNLYGIHHDPKHWEKPKEFYPGHFLSPDGEYRPSKFLIPFSMGKRSCLGESLARTELFVTLVGMMQQFKVRLANPDVNVDALLEGVMGFVHYPLPHEIIFERLSSAA